MTITPLRVGLRGGSERRTASFSEQVLPQIFSALGRASGRSDLAERFSASAVADRGVAALYRGLSQGERDALASSIGVSTLNELGSLIAESDPELLGEGLLSLAAKLENAGQEGHAQLLYESLLGVEALPNASISSRARDRLAVLQGGGSFGARFERHARHLIRDASDPALLAGMGAAGLVSGVVRFGVLSRLMAQPAGWLTRGFGARFTAGAASLAFEAPAFTAAIHGTNFALGRPQDLSLNGLGHELGSGYLLLGALRLSGGLTQSVASRFARRGALTSGQSVGLHLLEQGGTFGGILAANKAEQFFNLRPRTSGENMAFDALATMLQFRIGSRLADSAFGPAYHGALREMQVRGEVMASNSGSGRGLFDGIAGESLAPAGANGLAPAFEGPESPTILHMSMRPPPKGANSLMPESAGIPRRVEIPRPSDSRVTTLPAATEAFNQWRALKTPAARLRGLKEIYESGRLATLGLEAEFHSQRASITADELLAARNRLLNLENDFESYFAAESGKVSPEQRWERFQKWQNDLYPNDVAGLSRVQEIAKAMGLPNFFAFKAEAINLKSRIKRNQEAADYYYNLSLVRNFLRSEGLNRAEIDNHDGRLFSNLLLRGDGNCVTLSLLFAHLASRVGIPLEVGLLPRHAFLIAKAGGAIDSILDFGMVLSKPYLARAIGPENKPLPAQHLLTLHLLNLGKLGVDRGEHASAETVLQLARDLLPKNPRPYLELGRLNQHQGNVEAALENYRQVHLLDMHRYNNLRFRAWERIAVGDYRVAEESLRQMNDLRPGDIDVLRALKLVYELSDRPRLAAQTENLIEVMSLPDVD